MTKEELAEFVRNLALAEASGSHPRLLAFIQGLSQDERLSVRRVLVSVLGELQREIECPTIGRNRS